MNHMIYRSSNQLAGTSSIASLPHLTRTLHSTASAWQQEEDKDWAIHQTSGNRTDTVSVTSEGVDIQRSVSQHPSWSLTELRNSLIRNLQATFLPSGYPSTVSPGYLRYVAWQTAHHAAGSANGVLASTFLLYGVGLGAGAIPTAGALNWVLKDGLGQLGTLLFGRAMAHNFDVASKTWYVAASAKLNLAMALEISTFVFPQLFLPIGAAANAVKGLAWMAGGSARSSFNVAFAADQNIGEITAKATSQTICTSLLGTSVGLAIASAIGQSTTAAAGCFAALATVHMWTGYESARSVPIATLNPSRLAALTAATLRGEIRLPTPAELSRDDPIFPLTKGQGFTVGSTLGQLAAREPALAAALLPLYRKRTHMLMPDLLSGKMHLVLHEDATAADAITASLQAAIWREKIKENRGNRVNSILDDSSGKSGGDTGRHSVVQISEAGRAALLRADELTPGMLEMLRTAGWGTSRVVIESRRRRAKW